jgi:hypothetical protein
LKGEIDKSNDGRDRGNEFSDITQLLNIHAFCIRFIRILTRIPRCQQLGDYGRCHVIGFRWRLFIGWHLRAQALRYVGYAIAAVKRNLPFHVVVNNQGPM